jgi:2-oxoglutarate ferredoxin oxidoreductase subunit beta
VIFNNDVHEKITGKDVREDNQIYLKHGERMIFGKNRDKGLVLRNNKFEVVTIGQNGITEKDIIIHNANDPEASTHYNLVRMDQPGFPVAMGIIRAVDRTVYEDMLYDQIAHSKEKNAIKCMDDLLKSGNVFELNDSKA